MPLGVVMQVMAYLIFCGECEEALAFYQQALDARLEFMVRFEDSPDQSCYPKGAERQIMHASLMIGDSRIMLSDDPEAHHQGHHGFALTISLRDMSQGRQVFNALAAGGEVKIPFEQSDWSEGFALVHDRFEIPWMINVAVAQ